MFTYCLVTKGRREFLPSALASLSVALQNEDVQVIIIDNGCPSDISQILSEWCQRSAKRAFYIRFDVNDASAPRVWDALDDFEIDWITFPGDDDVIKSEFLVAARDVIRKNPEVRALASSMRIIDSVGAPTGQLRRPASYSGDELLYLANALHQPPFQFPALFFKFNSIKTPLPKSRYIFDWWLSLNLILGGNFKISEVVAIDYRVHNQQESAVAPNRRKYFEAQVVLSRFINSELFSKYLLELTDQEKLNFWKAVCDKEPLYGDLEFGAAIKLELLLKLSDSTYDSSISGEMIGKHAALKGVFLQEGEVHAFLSAEQSRSTMLPANFRIKVAEGSCAVISRLGQFGSILDVSTSTFFVGCSHAKGNFTYVLNCENTHQSYQEILDLLLVKITNQLEAEGQFDFKITPIERTFVKIFRRAKNKLPNRVFRYSKKMLTRSKS
jgi:hypothetical protein